MTRVLTPQKENPRLDFKVQNFKDKVIEKGYDIKWEKMLICPCRKDITSQADSNCINCNGTGYYWFDPTNIIAMISSIAVQKRFIQWTEDLTGTAFMTINPEYKVGWMDKITVMSAESMFSEVCNVYLKTGEPYIKTRYDSLEVVGMFEFVDSVTQLNQLDPTQEIESNVNKEIKLTSTYIAGTNISILYKHNPVYLVNDLLNDYRNTYVKKQMTTDTNKEMPIRVMIKKAHLLV